MGNIFIDKSKSMQLWIEGGKERRRKIFLAGRDFQMDANIGLSGRIRNQVT
jgi:hypothetical protein